MTVWRAHLLTLLAAVVVAVPPALADEPKDWLMRMDEAFVKHNYDGMFSYFNGADMASLRVVHMVVDGVQRERLVHMNGAPREIVRNGEDVSCIVMPGDDLIEIEKSMPAGPFARAFVRQFDGISAHYSLSFVGVDRVAGRTARRLAVKPKDEHRFGFRLWLDEETALLLRSEQVDEDGGRLEIFQFTHIEIGDAVDPRSLEPQTEAGNVVSHLALSTSEPSDSMQANRWQAGWLPPGFTMAAADVRRTKEALTTVETLVYTDGVAAFSVFVEDMPKMGASGMVSRNGATVAVTELLQKGGIESLITVVGELPTRTAQRIAQSVRPAELNAEVNAEVSVDAR